MSRRCSSDARAEARAADERRAVRRGRLGRAGAARGVSGARPALPADRARLGADARGSVKERLARLSDRFSGPQAINLRHQPIPWAYRVFYRHIGLDPDEQPTPVEAVALERIKQRRLRQPEPARRRAHDRDHRVGRRAAGLRRRPRRGPPRHPPRPAGARRWRAARAPCPTGTLVIADEARPLALLFGAVGGGPGREPEHEADAPRRDPGEGRAGHRRRGGDLAGGGRAAAAR